MNDFRWSFSQWETYNACPAKWKFKSVLKLPGLPPGPAAARGLEIHATVEKYIMGECGVDGLHSAVKPKYLPVLNGFRDAPQKSVEEKAVLDTNWAPVGPAGGTPWAVMIFDALSLHPNLVEIGEWKSGKPKDTHEDQRKLYALGALATTEAETVKVTTYYLEDTAPPAELTVDRGARDKLQSLWRGRVEQMQTDQFCAPRPGMHCTWCDYSKKKGGPCGFGS